MYRVLRKIRDDVYEDFGIKSTKKDADILANVSAILMGYKIEDYIIEEVE